MGERQGGWEGESVIEVPTKWESGRQVKKGMLEGEVDAYFVAIFKPLYEDFIPISTHETLQISY